MTLAGDHDRIGEPALAPAGGALPGSRKRRAGSWLAIAALALLGAYFASGFYVVGPDQRAVVRRFGAVADQVGPGMHYRVPWPVDQVTSGSPSCRTASTSRRKARCSVRCMLASRCRQRRSSAPRIQLAAASNSAFREYILRVHLLPCLLSKLRDGVLAELQYFARRPSVSAREKNYQQG
jgi:hypothetical protein